jgi:hypothetical protein
VLSVPEDEAKGERVTGRTMKRTGRDWATIVLLSSQVLIPALTVAMSFAVDTPKFEDIDWRGETLPARALDALLIAHLFIALCLVAVMRRRPLAVAIGASSLVVSVVLNFGTWLSVTGVYF